MFRVGFPWYHQMEPRGADQHTRHQFARMGAAGSATQPVQTRARPATKITRKATRPDQGFSGHFYLVVAQLRAIGRNDQFQPADTWVGVGNAANLRVFAKRATVQPCEQAMGVV